MRWRTKKDKYEVKRLSPFFDLFILGLPQVTICNPSSLAAAFHSCWSTLSRWCYTRLVWYGILSYCVVCWSTLSRWYYTRPSQYRGKRSLATEDISLWKIFLYTPPFLFSTSQQILSPSIWGNLAKSSSRSSCSSKNGLFLTLRRAVPGQATGSTD